MTSAENNKDNGTVRENRMYKIMGLLLSVVSLVLVAGVYQVTQITRQVTIMTEAIAENTNELARLPEKFVAIPKYERIIDIKDNNLKVVRDTFDSKLVSLEFRINRSNAAIIEQMRCIVEKLDSLFGASERLAGRLESIFQKDAEERRTSDSRH